MQGSTKYGAFRLTDFNENRLKSMHRKHVKMHDLEFHESRESQMLRIKDESMGYAKAFWEKPESKGN